PTSASTTRRRETPRAKSTLNRSNSPEVMKPPTQTSPGAQGGNSHELYAHPSPTTIHLTLYHHLSHQKFSLHKPAFPINRHLDRRRRFCAVVGETTVFALVLAIVFPQIR